MSHLSTAASGDILYGGSNGIPVRLAVGSDGQVLTLASGTPSWATPSVSSELTYSVVADTAYTISGVGDRYVHYTSISATRIVTLPSASASEGQILWICDASGSVTPSVKITVNCAGTDKIQGSTLTSVDISVPYGRLGLISDGTKWVVMTRRRIVYRWHFDGALATTTKQPYYQVPTAGRIQEVRHVCQTAGTGTIIIKVAGTDTYTITCAAGNSTTAYTSDSTTQTSIAAGALLQCRCSSAGTEADVTVEVVMDEWTI